MLTLLGRLEQMGRQGGMIALSISVIAGLLTLSLLFFSFQPEEGLWGPGLMRGLALLFFSLGAVFGMVGARILTARVYPSVESLFPSLSKDDFIQAVADEPRPLCVCTRCMIHLPGQFSTGSCPRCASSVDYYEITTDEDASMVLLSLS